MSKSKTKVRKIYNKKYTKEYAKKVRQRFFWSIILTVTLLAGAAIYGQMVSAMYADLSIGDINFKAKRHLPANPDRSDLTIEEQIRKVARDNSFAWPDYLVNLACCEGEFATSTVNEYGNTPAESRDRGLFGINDHWHAEVSDECSMDLQCSAEWTMWMIESGHQEQWMCDDIIKGNKDYWKSKNVCVARNI